MSVQQPAIVELIGPAGAGKSTLLRALRAQVQQLPSSNRPLGFFTDRLPARDPQNLPFYLMSGLRTFPTLLRLLGQGATLRREELSRLLYLQGMPAYFTHHRMAAHPTLVDQGPIFELTHLQAFGSATLHTPAMRGWWAARYQRWAPLLAMVIWLDAPDAVLIPRIQARNQDHIIKALSPAAAAEVLARYRRSFTTVMTALQQHVPLPVLHIRTDETEVAALVTQVLENPAVGSNLS
ncbi:MAG: hypothetical protein KDE47_15125 [Caldilineaceae bacterium]|nr:hypothetical protein [Caldilineaceae bacterium]